MKILSLNQTKCDESDSVFAASWLRAATATICMCVMAVAAGYLVVFGQMIGHLQLPRPLAGLALLFFFLARLGLRQWQAGRRPTSWVMRVRGDEVLVKFRSYYNWRLADDDLQVIALQRDEIEFAREATTTQVTREPGHGAQMMKLVYLEIGLKNHDTAALEKALVEEAARPGWGSKWQRTKYLDNPVQVVDKGVIRIAWNGGTAVRPGIKAALEALGQIVDVAEKRKGIDDFTATALKNLGEEEQKKRLTELAVRDRVKAVDAVRELYGCSVGEAMQMVNDFIEGAES